MKLADFPGHEAEEHAVFEMLQHALDLIHAGDSQGAEAVLAEALHRFHATEAEEAQEVEEALPYLQGKVSMASVLPSFFASIMEQGARKEAAGLGAPLAGAGLGAGATYLLQRPGARQDRGMADMGVISPEEMEHRDTERLLGLGLGGVAGAGLGMAAPWIRGQVVPPMQSLVKDVSAPAVRSVGEAINAKLPAASEAAGRAAARGIMSETGKAVGESPMGRAWKWLRGSA